MDLLPILKLICFIITNCYVKDRPQCFQAIGEGANGHTRGAYALRKGEVGAVELKMLRLQARTEMVGTTRCAGASPYRYGISKTTRLSINLALLKVSPAGRTK